MKTKKFFKLSFTEFNGEHEYYHNYLLTATTEKQAEKIGRKWVKDWYDGGYRDGGDDYAYKYNENICRFHFVVEITKEDFVQELLEKFTIV